MLIIRLLRFLNGYVSFKAQGGFCERFVNLCTGSKIPLWNMKREKDSLYAQTTPEGYMKIRKAARRSGSKVRICEKHGLPFFLRQNRERRGLLIGMAAAVLIVIILSGNVWSITLTGNSTLTNEQVLEAFKSEGVYVGARKSKIQPEEIKYNVLKILPELLWANVNIKGSRVEIVIKERTPVPEFPDSDTPCNIIADEDGEITAVNAEIGSPQVREGDLVLKGDLLISGVVENLDLSTSFKASRGNVYAKVKRQVHIVNTDLRLSALEKRKTRYTFSLLGLEIPLGIKPEGENLYKSSSYLADNDVVLPLGIITEHSLSFAEATVPGDRDYLLFLLRNYAREYRKIYLESEITQEDFALSENGSASEITAHFICVKDIAKKSEILIENR